MTPYRFRRFTKRQIVAILLSATAIYLVPATALARKARSEWKLVWGDEFNVSGRPNTAKWNFEQGYVRNYEAQWYTPDNIYQRDGLLVIEARPANFPCPDYSPDASNWRNSREWVNWTSGSLITKDRFTFCYGRLEVRARIPVNPGAWPAIWLLGSEHPWPANGEVDVLEYYQLNGEPTILANACWAGDTEEDTRWDDSYWPLSHFTEQDPDWADKFHVWRMDWDKDFIRIYLDGELLNEIDLSKTVNGKVRCQGINPFHFPQYLLLNLALDTRVKEYDPAIFPIRYEIDYVRVYARR